MKKMNKKGAEMTVGTIVIIVLALIVLVVLVLGFTGGWGNLWGRITSFFGGANVDSIVQACQMACTTEAKYDYCDRERTVKTDSEVFVVNIKGKVLATPTEIAKKEDLSAAQKNLKTAKQALGENPDDLLAKTAVQNAEAELDKLAEKKSKEGKASCKELADWYGNLGFLPCEDLC